MTYSPCLEFLSNKQYEYYLLFAIVEICELCVLAEELGDTLQQIVLKIKQSLSGTSLQFYEKEFSFFDEITSISGEIRFVRY